MGGDWVRRHERLHSPKRRQEDNDAVRYGGAEGEEGAAKLVHDGRSGPRGKRKLQRGARRAHSEHERVDGGRWHDVAVGGGAVAANGE